MGMESLKVTQEEMDTALERVEQSFLNALNRAADQIESFHRQQLGRSWINTERPGTLLGQLINPVDAAGVYVPGEKGRNPLVSSALMGAIPAGIAGVKDYYGNPAEEGRNG